MKTHELEGIWAKILRTLRTENNFALFGLLATMNDVEFATDKIIIHAHNETEKKTLNQHWVTLKKLAGETVTVEIQDDTVVVFDENRDYIARLKELFGDKVKIM